jgi:carbamoyl-phosphate synthase large subunit
MQKTTVLVTGVGGGGHGEQILKALRLAGTGYHVVAGDMSPYSAGLMGADTAYVLPPATDPGYIEAVLKVCRAHEVRAVFHGSEPELKAMSANRDAFAAEGFFLPINPAPVIDLCMDKARTCEFLEQHGFRTPAFQEVSAMEHLEAFDHLPAVLKPSVGGGGSANLFLAQTRDELMFFGRYLLSLYPAFIVQEYVGTPHDEYTVGVLLDMDGGLVNSIAVRRHILSSLSNRLKVPNRTGRAELGPVLAISSGVSQGEIGRFPQVTEACERMALALGCRGAVNVQCRLVDGEVQVFEINPRFSGTTSLRALVGYNEPDVLIRRHVLGQEVERGFAYREGLILRGLAETYIENRPFPRAAEL